jgi:hypothetical protein
LPLNLRGIKKRIKINFFLVGGGKKKSPEVLGETRKNKDFENKIIFV